MSKNNILIIGNGFDLYHGLRTGYKDFVDFSSGLIKADRGTEGKRWAVNNSFVKCFVKVLKENQSWIDCENEIEIIVSIIKKLLYDKNVVDRNYIMRNENSLFYTYEFERLKLMSDGIIKKANESNIEFNSLNFSKYQGIDKRRIMGRIEKELDYLILLFQFYLKNNVINEPINKTSEQIKALEANYVINFNYTHTYERYNIKKENVCFIHGSVLDNNMVLGIRDIDIKDIDTIYFKKYFQRIKKHTDVIKWSKFDNQAYAHFFGHSLSSTDGDIIRDVYDRSEKIIVYYMLNYRDYEQKVINLIDSLGKDVVIEGMYSGKIDFVPIK